MVKQKPQGEGQARRDFRGEDPEVGLVAEQLEGLALEKPEAWLGIVGIVYHWFA
jgi:hypothetical protein